MPNLILFAFATVAPLFVNHNRVPGNTPTMTNVQAWSSSVSSTVVDATNATLAAAKAYTDSAVVSAGAVTPPIVTNITDAIIASSNLCTLAAAQQMANERLSTSSPYGSSFGTMNWSNGSYNLEMDGSMHVAGLFKSDNIATDGTVSLYSINGWSSLYSLYLDQTLPQYLASTEWHGTNKSLADYGIVNAYTKTEADNISSNTHAIVQTWESFLDGSNVVFSITNYISGAYNLNTAKLRILEMTNGVYREVYNSRGEIVMHLDDFKTNDFNTATNSIVSSLESQIVEKADKAWGKYTSAGGEAPSNTVYMTSPNTVFAGGMEYERVAVGLGTVCVLTTKGAPTYTSGDEGTFKFQDDGGTNYFGFAKSDSYTLGCNTDGITVTANIVTLVYDVTMSGTPCIWYKQSLENNTPWEQLNTPDGQPIPGASKSVSWDTTTPGRLECFINCSEASGFFKATIEVAGAAKFMTNMPADLMRGIICTNTATSANGVIKPSYNGSQVIWTWSEQ